MQKKTGRTMSWAYRMLKKIGMAGTEKEAPASAHGAARKLRRRREHEEAIYKELYGKNRK